MTFNLPIVDLESPSVPVQLDRAFSDVGFCYLVNTGVPTELVSEAFAASRTFHALPAETKAALAINEFHRGYIGAKTSLIRSSSVATVTRPNLSESLMVMHYVDRDDPRFGEPLQGPNQWPDLPGFRPLIERYEQAMRSLCLRLMHDIAIALGHNATVFDDFFARPTTWLRLLRYPPHPANASKAEFGSAPHTDYGFITVLAQDALGALEVRSRSGTWLSAPPMEDAFILNAADLLAIWSNRRWLSTPHRVKNLHSDDRYSIPYFFDPSLDTVVSPLDGTPTPSVNFGEYVLDRLNRNYKYRQTI